MKILMIAPEPVFRIRGTPFSVRDRCRAYSDAGHTVDLLTYPFGEDFSFPGVTIHRTRRVPGIKDVKIGFSWTKIPLDALLFIKAFLALRRGGYDLIHTHEEAGMMGALLTRWFKIPHLYDMHSSLPQQFENYGTSSARPVLAMMEFFERFILKNSHAVIAICPHLRDIARKSVPAAPVHVIENLAQPSDAQFTADQVRDLKSRYDLENRFVVGYTGTFEMNQGLDILIRAFALFNRDVPEAVLFLVGGADRHIRETGELCRQANIWDNCRLPGRIPMEQMAVVMAACDVLVSPRKLGTNTPLKLYSYLRSGVPILATNLLTHTQVLDDSVAVLTDPTPESLAEGLFRLYRNPELCRKLGSAAQEKEKNEYSYPVYQRKLAQVVRSALDSRE